MDMYGEKREIEARTEDALPKAALETWIEGPIHEQLKTLLPKDVAVLDATIEGDTATVDFSQEIENANLGSGGEMFVVEQIALTMLQFGAPKTQILIEGQVEETLAGHVTICGPVEAPDPDEFEVLE